MSPGKLLAKSVATTITLPNSATLIGHLNDCRQSASDIVKAVGQQMLNSLGLSGEQWLERLSKTLPLAAALHDIGKANNHFQSAVHGTAAPSDRQPIRHEWISVWVAMQPAVKDWLLSAIDNCEKSWHIVMYAISGHHPKIDRSAPTDECFGAQKIEVLVGHSDFRDSLLQIAKWFELALHLYRQLAGLSTKVHLTTLAKTDLPKSKK